MRKPFCQNIKCDLSSYTADERVLEIEIDHGYAGRQRSKRHLYKNKNGDRIFLCDSCHEAVQLITS